MASEACAQGLLRRAGELLLLLPSEARAAPGGEKPAAASPLLPLLVMGAAAAAAAFAGFYLRRAAQRPMLVASAGFRRFLDDHCPMVHEKFYPTFWCTDGRAQTVVRVLLKTPVPVHYRNELIRTADGGHISLDWADNDASERHPDGATRPTLLLLPGLTGSSRESYMLYMVRTVLSMGYRCVVFNNRGFGGEALLTPRTFCAADTEDLEAVLDHVRSLLPDAPLVGTGVSLGGMLLLNYVSRSGSECRLSAVLTLSAAWDTFASCDSLERPLHWLLFNRFLTGNLRRTVHRHRDVLASKFDIEHIMKARTIREFDQRFTAPMFGFATIDDYYRAASPAHAVAAIRIPVLCLNAADDPFSPMHAIPVEAARSNPRVALLVTSSGGHIGFLEGLVPRGRSYMDRVFAEFTRAALEHAGELEELTGQRGAGAGCEGVEGVEGGCEGVEDDVWRRRSLVH
ncbi:phospholipase ABHD3-like isoform X2 [Lampetra fluviatilis]